MAYKKRYLLLFAIIFLAISISVAFLVLKTNNISKILKAEKIEFSDNSRFKPDNYLEYKGVIQTQKELEKLWGFMVDDPYGDNSSKRPPLLLFDLNKYTVIWFADKGKNASFVYIREVIENKNTVNVYLNVVYSDFGSNHLNLWKIPKTTKKVELIENEQSEKGWIP